MGYVRQPNRRVVPGPSHPSTWLFVACALCINAEGKRLRSQHRDGGLRDPLNINAALARRSRATDFLSTSLSLVEAHRYRAPMNTRAHRTSFGASHRSGVRARGRYRDSVVRPVIKPTEACLPVPAWNRSSLGCRPLARRNGLQSWGVRAALRRHPIRVQVPMRSTIFGSRFRLPAGRRLTHPPSPTRGQEKWGQPRATPIAQALDQAGMRSRTSGKASPGKYGTGGCG